ncbi:MAG TPA: Crp/Fnr family transcriptional regulator [Candidatus Saccharimonadales bacterium]|nr:Crp/Fnr family transcriptional regulator [Candidatus Saccharimonadales bacterium]
MAKSPATKIEEFFASYPESTYRKTRILLRPGEELTHVFYLADGTVRQYDINPKGEKVVINVFKPGAFFPMSYAVNHTPNEYFFETATEAHIRQAPVAEVLTFLQTHVDVLYDLLARVFSGTDGLLRRLAHSMGGSAQTRLSFELLNACRRFGTHRGKRSYFVPLSETELAARTGLTRETVSRCMRQLKQSGIAELARGGYVIHDLARLETELGDGL